MEALWFAALLLLMAFAINKGNHNNKPKDYGRKTYKNRTRRR